jgi:hypothetical protein
LFSPREGGGYFSRRVGLQFDVIVLADAVGFFLEPADAFPQFCAAFFGTWTGQAVGDGARRGCKKCPKTLGHGLFLLTSGWCIAL